MFFCLNAPSPARQRTSSFLRPWLADVLLLLANSVSSASAPGYDGSALQALLIRSQAAVLGGTNVTCSYLSSQLTSSVAFSYFMFVWYEPTINIISAVISLLQPGRKMLLYQLEKMCAGITFGEKNCLLSAFMWSNGLSRMNFKMKTDQAAVILPHSQGCSLKDWIWLTSRYYHHHKHSSNANGAFTDTTLPAWLEV